MSFSNYLKSFIFVIVIAAIWSYFFGFYSQSASDALLKGLASGVYSGQPLDIPMAVKSYIGLTHLFTWLYACFPNIPWYDLFLFTCITICLTNSFVLFYNKKDVLGTILCFGVIFTALFSIEFTEVTIFLSFSSILLIYHLHNKKIQTTLFVFALLSFLMRPEGAFLGLIVVIPFILYNKLTLSGFTRSLFIAIILFGVSSYVLSHFSFMKVDERFNPIKPYVYSFWNNSHYLNEKNFGDKGDVVVQSGIDSFIGDSAFYNKEYLNKIGVPYKDRSFVSLAKFLSNGHALFISKAVELCNYCAKHYELIFIFLVVNLIYFNQTKRFILTTFYVFILLYLVTYLMKMEDRIFVPVFVSTIFGILLTGEPKNMDLNLSNIFLFITVYAFLTINITQFVKTQIIYKNFLTKIENFTHDLYEKYNKPLIINFSSLHLFNRKLFTHKKMLGGKHPILTIDDIWMYMYPKHEKYLRKFIPVDRYGNFKKYFLKLMKQDYLFLTQQHRLSILNNYVKNIYGLEIESKRVYQSLELDLEREEKFDLRLYEVGIK